MKAFVIGATGVLGREAVPQLRAAGHEVGVLDRHTTSMFDEQAMVSALTGYEAVVNLATRIPHGLKMLRASGWAENDRIRTEGTATLARAAAQAGVRVVVQEGISFVYADGGDNELDETAPIDAIGPTRTSVVAQENVLRHPGGVFLRIGMLLGGAAAPPPVFVGNGWMSAVHPADAAAAAVAALGASPGVYNVGADPVRKHDMPRLHLPQALARFAFVFGRSQRVVTHKLTAETGWRPRHDARTLL